MDMNITTLENTGIEKITDTFNLSFSDYLIPFHLTPEQLLSKMKTDKVVPGYSVGVFEGEDMIAFILHGADIINGRRVIYNGGTGVIPERRGQGLTKQMYDYILPSLRTEGMDYLVLEAISGNIQAIKSYRKSGFEVARGLRCYKGLITPEDQSDRVVVNKLERYDWMLMQSFWDFVPTWQNSANILDELIESNISLGAYIKGRLAGYLIYNPASRRIQQLAVDKNFRRMKVASSLISVIVKEYGNDLSMINVDEDSGPMDSFLIKTGFDHFLNQVEMKLMF